MGLDLYFIVEESLEILKSKENVKVTWSGSS